MLLRMGYWWPVAGGMLLVVLGSLPLIWLDRSQDWRYVWASMTVMGTGFGFTVPPMFIALQMQVERKYMGAATSLLQFSRNMGGSVAVGVMGAVFNLREKSAGFDRALETAFLVSALVTVLGVAVVLAAPKLSAQELRQRRGEAPAV
jgi:sugar phosphate permease